ncbi:MAG: hypothetical protein ABL963_07545 [Longimicrobiales bacterium]
MDRRSFLRRAGAAALAAPAASLVGCGDGAPDVGAVGGAPDGAPTADPALLRGDIVRPILFPWSEEAVWMDAPTREMPVAYVSMGSRQLFVDSAFRDQVYWDLKAHISVSTGVWRIPLVGDSPREAVVPGDVLREFEELSEREWDPTARPSLGDIRLTRGTATPRHVELMCAPLAGGGTWLRAGPWDIVQSAAPTAALVREDFGSIGRAMRFADRDCTRPRGEADVLTWSCLPATLAEG